MTIYSYILRALLLPFLSLSHCLIPCIHRLQVSFPLGKRVLIICLLLKWRITQHVKFTAFKGTCCKSISWIGCADQMGNCWTCCKKIWYSRGCSWWHDKGDDEGHHVELAGGNVHLVTKTGSWEAMLSEANRDGKILVANFSAQWCCPCRTIAPVYHELADRYPSIIFVTVDVDELAEFSTMWDIKATPTIIFLKDGRQLDRLVGANKTELQKKTAAVADLAKQVA